jgi:hypothetical protein
VCEQRDIDIFETISTRRDKKYGTLLKIITWITIRKMMHREKFLNGNECASTLKKWKALMERKFKKSIEISLDNGCT